MHSEYSALQAGDIVPASGIYGVHHAEHHLVSEIVLFKGERCPNCATCGGRVIFALFRSIIALDFQEVTVRTPIRDLNIIDTGRGPK